MTTPNTAAPADLPRLPAAQLFADQSAIETLLNYLGDVLRSSSRSEDSEGTSWAVNVNHETLDALSSKTGAAIDCLERAIQSMGSLLWLAGVDDVHGTSKSDHCRCRLVA